MKLKSIEIQGFKSFVDRTRLDFKEGITAILGPNGCGKSNVVDAIRWVLGEQSAKTLRGGKMDDVIFKGTTKRRPVGMAEVTLTFSNEDRGLNIDFSEVAIRRRVTRDGGSDYFLNGSPWGAAKRAVRLKPHLQFQLLFEPLHLHKLPVSSISGKQPLEQRPSQRILYSGQAICRASWIPVAFSRKMA